VKLFDPLAVTEAAILFPACTGLEKITGAAGYSSYQA
jgi:hypothetical protein